MKRSLALAISAMLMCGCTVYHAPDIPPDQQARIRIVPVENGGFMETRMTSFNKIDDAIPVAYDKRHELVLSAGKHTIEVAYMFQKSCAFPKLTFNAQAGLTYVFRLHPIGSVDSYASTGPGSVPRLVETSVELSIDGLPDSKVSADVVLGDCKGR